MSKVIGLWETASLVPHRYPFLFLNEVEIDSSGGTKKGLTARAILPSVAMEFWLQGPERIFLKTLVIEFFAQMIGVAFLHCNPEYRDQPCFLGGVEKAAFELPVIAKDGVEGEVVICGSTSNALRAHGILYRVSDRVPLVTATFTCGFSK